MTDVTIADLRRLINRNMPDNEEGAITPAKVREVLHALVGGIEDAQREILTVRERPVRGRLDPGIN